MLEFRPTIGLVRITTDFFSNDIKAGDVLAYYSIDPNGYFEFERLGIKITKFGFFPGGALPSEGIEKEEYIERFSISPVVCEKVTEDELKF